MPRLTNSKTGVVVNVDDATAAALGSEWQADKPAEKPKRPTARTPKKKSD